MTMQNRSYFALVSLSAAVVAAGSLFGCSTVESMATDVADTTFAIADVVLRPTTEARIQVPASNPEETIEVVVRSSKSDRSRKGVAHMRRQEWIEAVDLLEQELRNKRDDFKSMFALGVAYEMSHHYRSALTQYEKVALADSKGTHEEAVTRIRQKIGGHGVG